MGTAPEDDMTVAGPGGDEPTRAGVDNDLTRAGAHADLTRPEADPDVTRAPPGIDGAVDRSDRPVSRGRYRLGAALGEGGMAVVVEAEDLNLHRPVALKQLREGLRSDGASRQRFFDEAEILASLEHAGVVPVHEAGLLEDGAPFYAMARVRGRTLADLMNADAGRAYRVSMRLVDIVLRATETVGHAHARGLMHLDLKPQNIMVDEDGAVYVMDWGISRRIGAPAHAERGVMRGTPSYMSPEVASGRGDEADARSDVFALGVMLYEVLTGQRPFHGDTKQVMQAVASATPVPPRQLARHVPRELSAICMKALARDPSQRYRTARELAADLRDSRDHLPITALTPSLGDRVVKWLRRHPRAATAMATGLIALLVFGSVRAYRVASERAMLEALWSHYQTIAADLDRLEAQLAEPGTGAPSAGASADERRRDEAARAELAERIELRAGDARSVAGAALGLTRGTPDPRLVRAMSARLRRDLDRARARGDLVRVKVLAETRLTLLDELRGQIDWPEEDVAFLRERLAEATAALNRPGPP